MTNNVRVESHRITQNTLNYHCNSIKYDIKPRLGKNTDLGLKYVLFQLELYDRIWDIILPFNEQFLPNFNSDQKSAFFDCMAHICKRPV